VNRPFGHLAVTTQRPKRFGHHECNVRGGDEVGAGSTAIGNVAVAYSLTA